MMLVRGIDDPDDVEAEFCATSVVPIALLSADLSSVSWAPRFSFSGAVAVRGVKDASVADEGTEEVIIVGAEEEGMVDVGAEEEGVVVGVEEEGMVVVVARGRVAELASGIVVGSAAPQAVFLSTSS
jgi:hypothetical protein